MKRHPQILRRSDTALIIVDVQERINAVMMDRELIIRNIARLVQASQILDLPILFTEQYPEGLGPTEPQLLEVLSHITPVQKMSFSCCGSEEFNKKLLQTGATQIVLAGIESHVCVQQTALDLFHQEYQIHVPADAVTSRKQLDYDTAIRRMTEAGIIITTTESVLFELMKNAGTPEFKNIAKLIK